MNLPVAAIEVVFPHKSYKQKIIVLFIVGYGCISYVGNIETITESLIGTLFDEPKSLLSELSHYKPTQYYI